MSLLEHLFERSEEDADAFIRAGGESMSYGSLMIAVRALADAIVQQAGDLRRRALGIAVEDQAGFIASVLAGFALDAVVVPLDLRAGLDAARRQAERARVTAMIVGDTAQDRLDVVPVDASRRELDARARLILHTSGSSGAAKRVVLSEAGLMANLDAILGYLPIEKTSRTPLTLPLVYSYSLVGQALTTLRAGGALVGLGAIAYPSERLQAMKRLGCDGLSTVAPALATLAELAAGWPEPERPRFRYVASAGGPLDRATVEMARQAFPRAKLFNQYGLTEASPRVTAISEREPAFLPADGRGSVGRPIAGVEVRAVDGFLEVRSPSVMLGYLDDAEATAQAFTADGWLKTGDRGRVDDEGYVWVDGRADDLVKVGGERVSLDEVADTLRGVTGVREAAVVAVEDARLGHRLRGFVVLGETSLPSVQEALKHELPAFKRPALTVLRSLPRTPNGKIDLQALKGSTP